MQNQTPRLERTESRIPPLDTRAIAENGDSPAAIILAIAFLVAILFGGVTRLIRVLSESR